MARHVDADSLKNDGHLCWHDSKGKVYYEIDHAPTADVVEVKHSEWILHKDGSGTCKQCGFTQKNVWDFDNWQNFCGHCGADMRKG